MKQGIRNELSEKLNLTKDEVETLIRMYSKNHEGKVNPYEIIRDVETIANDMIYQVGYMYHDYDVTHELLDCGKDRVYDAMMALAGMGNKGLANEYLGNYYADTVDEWMRIFYKTAQRKLQEILNYGIDQYRSFVKSLPYENVYRVAELLDMQSEVAEFLALNGEAKDLQIYMTDTRPKKDTDELYKRRCPRKLTDKIFGELQKTAEDGSYKEFNRASIMKGLSSLNKNKNLKEEEKEKLEKDYIKQILEGKSVYGFNTLSYMEEKYDVLNEFLERCKEQSPDEVREFAEDKLKANLEVKIKDLYNKFIEDLENQMKEGKITAEEFFELVRNSGLPSDEMMRVYLEENEETKITKFI